MAFFNTAAKKATGAGLLGKKSTGKSLTGGLGIASLSPGVAIAGSAISALTGRRKTKQKSTAPPKPKKLPSLE